MAWGSATIAGGGLPNLPNSIYDHSGTIAGGVGNRAGSDNGSAVDAAFTTIGGGYQNVADANNATIAGGQKNHAGEVGSVGGGLQNGEQHL